MLLPRATKTSLVKLVREKGYDVPSIRDAAFSTCGRRSYFLDWATKDCTRHHAYYTGVGGRPWLSVDGDAVELTMAEVIHFGLVEAVEAKENAPDAAGTTSRAKEGENPKCEQ